MHILQRVQEDSRNAGHGSPQKLPPHRYLCSYSGKKKDRYIFRIESVGQLSPVAIVKKSMAVLRDKLKEIEEGIH